MKNRFDHHWATEELRALERAAHGARSLELLRLIRSGASGLKSILAAATHGGGKVGHA
jgi:hypothetical protein